jgi:hypothetical protein
MQDVGGELFPGDQKLVSILPSAIKEVLIGVRPEVVTVLT